MIHNVANPYQWPSLIHIFMPKSQLANSLHKICIHCVTKLCTSLRICSGYETEKAGMVRARQKKR